MVASTVALFTSLLVHTPLEVAFVKVMVEFAQTIDGPAVAAITGPIFTVIFLVTVVLQPAVLVKV